MKKLTIKRKEQLIEFSEKNIHINGFDSFAYV